MAISGSNSFNPYQEALQGVETILSSSGQSPGVAVASASLGDVTVTATPTVQRMVREYLRAIARQSQHNVMVGVRIYEVTLNNSTSIGGSLALAFKNAAQTLSASTSGVNLLGALQNPANGLGSLSLIIPSGAATGTTPGALNGTQAVLEALDAVGRTALVTSGSVVTANGQTGPIQTAHQIVYLASSSTTSTTNAGTTASLTPGTLTVGFTANFLPRILTRDRIMLSCQMRLSSLIAMNTVSSGGSTIETPETQTQSDAQSIVLKNGQTLVMAGFGQANQQQGSGVGLLSGYGQNSRSRTEFIVMIHVAEVQP